MGPISRRNMLVATAAGGLAATTTLAAARPCTRFVYLTQDKYAWCVGPTKYIRFGSRLPFSHGLSAR